MKTRYGIVAGALAASSVAAVGDVVYDSPEDRPELTFHRVGFEDVSVGEAINEIDFGAGITASVSTSNNVANEVFAETDGYGAVQAEGERFWKLSGGETVLDFGQAELSAFEFMYSDLEWTTLAMDFGDTGTVELRDSNSGSPKLFGFQAEDGETFSTVSLRWRGRQNDGVGFDSVGVAGIPTPGSMGLLAAAGGLALVRRRR